MPAYLRSGLPTFRLTNVPAYLHVISCSTYLAFVHHQFKRNIYLSLLCDWIFLCLQNHFSFLSSKYAVEACDINILYTADLVHCLAIVQASHVICLHFCVADSVTPFPHLCFIFNLTQSAFSFPEPNISTDKILCWGAGGGGVGVYCSLSVGGRMEPFKIKGECHEGEG
jgi:hypothetical protein